VCGSHLFLLTNEEEEDRNCLPEPHYLWAEPIFFSSSSFLLGARHNRTPESGELRLSLSLFYSPQNSLFFFFFPEPHQHLESPISNIKGKKKNGAAPHCAAHPVAFISVSPAGSPDQIRRLNVII
jgi:hypothetical protein